MLRFLLALLGGLALLPAAAQTLCDPPTIRQLYQGSQGYAVADARGKILIPYAQRPLVVLTPALVKVAPDYRSAKWGVLDLLGRVRLPVAYDELDLDDANCGYLCARLPGHTSLYDPAGKLVYRRGGRYTLRAYPRWNVLVETTRPPKFQSSAGPDTLRLLDLATLRVLSRQTPADGGQPLHFPYNSRPGPPRLLPLFAVATGRNPGATQDRIRLLDVRGRVRYDSLDGMPQVIGRGLLYLYRAGRPVIVTDTLLRPVPWLSNQYDRVEPGGPGGRYWVVSRHGLSGVLDARGRPVLPVRQAGWLDYAGHNCWLVISTYQGTTYQLLRPGRRLLDLSPYYLGRGPDSTFTAQPLVLHHKTTGKYGLLDPLKGWLVAPRLERLTQVGNGLMFWQGDSVGYLDRRGRLRLLTPQCQELSAFFEGLAVCAKYVPNAMRQQFPSAQITYSTENYPFATQYAYLNEQGKLVTGYFDRVGAFRDGYAQVLKNEETYLINRQGQRAELPGGLQLASYFGATGLAVVQQGRHYGLADRTGRLALPVIYHHIATETTYPQPGDLASRHNANNHLLDFVTPRLTGGQATVTTDEGQEAQVPVK